MPTIRVLAWNVENFSTRHTTAGGATAAINIILDLIHPAANPPNYDLVVIIEPGTDINAARGAVAVAGPSGVDATLALRTALNVRAAGTGFSWDVVPLLNLGPGGGPINEAVSIFFHSAAVQLRGPAALPGLGGSIWDTPQTQAMGGNLHAGILEFAQGANADYLEFDTSAERRPYLAMFSTVAGGHEFLIMGAHSPSPESKYNFRAIAGTGRYAFIEELSSARDRLATGHGRLPALVMGDFNSCSRASDERNSFKKTNARDALEGLAGCGAMSFAEGKRASHFTLTSECLAIARAADAAVAAAGNDPDRIQEGQRPGFETGRLTEILDRLPGVQRTLFDATELAAEISVDPDLTARGAARAGAGLVGPLEALLSNLEVASTRRCPALKIDLLTRLCTRAAEHSEAAAAAVDLEEEEAWALASAVAATGAAEASRATGAAFDVHEVTASAGRSVPGASEADVAHAGGVGDVTLAATASDVDGLYAGSTIRITGGTATGERARITAYDGTTKVATVNPNWGTVPDGTSQYAISRTFASVRGTAVAASNPVLTLAGTAAPEDAAYDDSEIAVVEGAGAGQRAQVVAYHAATRRITLGQALDPVPDNTSTYRMFLSVEMHTGTARSGNVDDIELAAYASGVDGFYAGCEIYLTGGTGVGQKRTITKYDGGTRKADVSPDWLTVPAGTTTYRISEERAVFATGQAHAGAAGTITLAGTADANDDAYVGDHVEIVSGTSAGEIRAITAYAGMARSATVQSNWANAPDNTSCYRILRSAGRVPVATLQASAAATITLDAAASVTDGAYADKEIEITANPGVGQRRRIVEYTGATKSARIEEPWAVLPAGTSTYVVLDEKPVVHADYVQATDEVTLDAGASAIDGAYDACSLHLTVGAGAGQDTSIASYVGATKSARVETALQPRPDHTTSYDLRFTHRPTRGLAVGGGVNTIDLAMGASSVDHEYDGMVVRIVAGTANGEFKTIQNYNGLLRRATVANNWGVPPGVTSQYEVDLDLCLVELGTATGGAPATITLAAGANAANNHYVGMWIEIFAGLGAGGGPRRVTGYVGGTKVATVRTNWPATPNATSQYRIFGAGPAVTGTVQASQGPHVVLEASAVGTDDAYRDMRLEIAHGAGAGQSRPITGYTAATKVAELGGDWVTCPDPGSTYLVVETGGIHRRARRAADAAAGLRAHLLHRANGIFRPGLVSAVSVTRAMAHLATVAAAAAHDGARTGTAAAIPFAIVAGEAVVQADAALAQMVAYSGTALPADLNSFAAIRPAALAAAAQCTAAGGLNAGNADARAAAAAGSAIALRDELFPEDELYQCIQAALLATERAEAQPNTAAALALAEEVHDLVQRAEVAATRLHRIAAQDHHFTQQLARTGAERVKCNTALLVNPMTQANAHQLARDAADKAWTMLYKGGRTPKVRIAIPAHTRDACEDWVDVPPAPPAERARSVRSGPDARHRGRCAGEYPGGHSLRAPVQPGHAARGRNRRRRAGLRRGHHRRGRGRQRGGDGRRDQRR